MGYKLTLPQFDKYLTSKLQVFDIYAPVNQIGKGKFSDTHVIGYDSITSLSEIVFDKKSLFSPKEVFYPIRETLFYFMNNEIKEAAIETKPILLFLRPCDIHGIERLDSIFLNNGTEIDCYYLRRRQLLKLIMIECTEGFESCFCVSMGANITTHYDAVVRIEGDKVLFDTEDEALLTEMLMQSEEVVFEPEFIKENKIKVTLPEPQLITNEIFDHPLWTEYTNRCIACGRCNTSCISCSCFTMQDVKSAGNSSLGERRRVWASCHINDYTNMAGGHSLRNKNGDKMRFKTMHKINDFYKRFGSPMCVGCGRCDDACPEYISFSKCINKVNEVIEEGQKNV